MLNKVGPATRIFAFLLFMDWGTSFEYLRKASCSLLGWGAAVSSIKGDRLAGIKGLATLCISGSCSGSFGRNRPFASRRRCFEFFPANRHQATQGDGSMAEKKVADVSTARKYNKSTFSPTDN